MPTIQTDVANDEFGLDEAANAFLASFADTAADDASKKKPSEKKDEPPADDKPAKDEPDHDTEETDDEQSDESPDSEDEETEGDDEAEDEPKSKKYADDDDETYVKVKEGDTEHEVRVKDLKRLFGQEAALTRKSQEAAERTKVATESQAKSLAALDVMVKRAKEAADPYRQVNWVALAKDPNISAEEVTALQNMARAAFDNETFLTQELDKFMGQVQTQQQAERATAAKDCITKLTDEKSSTYIKGWNESLYNDLRSFGMEVGLHKDMVNNLTDPAAFKLLHMAMQFHRGAQKVVTQKVNKAPKKIVKTSAATPSKTAGTTAKQIDKNKAMSQLKKSGTLDDAANAFYASFKD